MTTRNLDNPLFDQYIDAVVPYLQHHVLWHRKWNEERGITDEDDYIYLEWDIGTSAEANNAVREKIADRLVERERELSELETAITTLVEPLRVRHEAVIKYAWAVPTEEALDAIVRHAPAGVVEIGAGTGYWARFLRARGLLVQAFDESPYESHNASAKWSEVLVGGPEKAAQWPQLALFLCWPPYDTPMAYECLRAYSGDTFLYIGEHDGGCTGDEAFHLLVEKQWKEVEYVAIPQWPGIRDGLFVYERR